ncbi:hypothetical protein HRG84_19200 [Flavisolibacter sp. BT320]|nr:hypothetical protein [Flavisolibacter longurius]
MNTCFLCGHMMVPGVPAACKNTLLRRAFDALQQAVENQQPPLVGDYTIRLFPAQKICLLSERFDPQKPDITLTKTLETAIVQVSSQYGLCPSLWTFVEHSHSGTGKKVQEAYDLVVLNHDDLTWEYLWHSDAPTEREPYSDSLLVRRIEQYRSGTDTIL